MKASQYPDRHWLQPPLAAMSTSSDLLNSAVIGLRTVLPGTQFESFAPIRVREDTRTAFRNDLWKSWGAVYMGRLFDEKDVSLAQTQVPPRPHGCGAFFFEWLSAILIADAPRYRSRTAEVRAARRTASPRKRRRLDTPSGKSVFASTRRLQSRATRLPDLGVLKPDSATGSVDAKGPRTARQDEADPVARLRTSRAAGHLSPARPASRSA